MKRILCIANKGSVEVVNQTVANLKDSGMKWVATSFETMKSPTGETLKPCSWHSGDCGRGEDRENPSLCYTDGCEFGIWTDGYTAYDTCWKIEEFYDKVKVKEIQACDRLIDNMQKRMDNIKEAHASFDVNVKHLRTLEEKLAKIEKDLQKQAPMMNLESPGYKVLVQLRDREKELVESRRKALMTVYEKSAEKMPFNEFFIKYCPELERLHKAEEKLTGWLNLHKAKTSAELIEQVNSVKRDIERCRSVIDKTFRVPYGLVSLLIRDLNRILTAYSKYKYTRPYDKESIKLDIADYTGMLYYYAPYLNGQNGAKIAVEVEREQEQAIKAERLMKSATTVHKVNNAGTYVPIVRGDGTITYDTKGERCIIGATVSSNENWRVGR